MKEMDSVRFRRAFSLSDAPRDWSLVNLSLDWDGGPLLLMAEGNPPRPEPSDGPDTWARWYQTPARARHLIFQDRDEQQSLRFDQSERPYHVQPFEDGWLLEEARGGRTTLYDRRRMIRTTLDLGDASEDLQTTPGGDTWVSYFDEGVYGGGIGMNGVVCFDSTGTPTFRYADFAEKQSLPFIDDCYAMNVTVTDDAWLNYYSAFPIVLIHGFNLEQAWLEFGCLGDAFAVERSGSLLHLRGSKLMRSSPCESRTAPEEVAGIDERGAAIAPLANLRGVAAARGPHLAFRAEDAVYELILV
jgi:hypothetical protein